MVDNLHGFVKQMTNTDDRTSAKKHPAIKQYSTEVLSEHG